MNMALVIWYSKKQNTVELYKFGSDFFVLETVKYMVLSLSYKLRMMGVTIYGEANVFS